MESYWDGSRTSDDLCLFCSWSHAEELALAQNPHHIGSSRRPQLLNFPPFCYGPNGLVHVHTIVIRPMKFTSECGEWLTNRIDSFGGVWNCACIIICHFWCKKRDHGGFCSTAFSNERNRLQSKQNICTGSVCGGTKKWSKSKKSIITLSKGHHMKWVIPLVTCMHYTSYSYDMNKPVNSVIADFYRMQRMLDAKVVDEFAQSPTREISAEKFPVGW